MGELIDTIERSEREPTGSWPAPRAQAESPGTLAGHLITTRGLARRQNRVSYRLPESTRRPPVIQALRPALVAGLFLPMQPKQIFGPLLKGAPTLLNNSAIRKGVPKAHARAAKACARRQLAPRRMLWSRAQNRRHLLPVLSAVDARFSYRGEDVVQTLERSARSSAIPRSIRVDQGSEFISRDLDLWAYQRGRHLDFSRPGIRVGNQYFALAAGNSPWCESRRNSQSPRTF